MILLKLAKMTFLAVIVLPIVAVVVTFCALYKSAQCLLNPSVPEPQDTGPESFSVSQITLVVVLIMLPIMIIPSIIMCYCMAVKGAWSSNLSTNDLPTIIYYTLSGGLPSYTEEIFPGHTNADGIRLVRNYPPVYMMNCPHGHGPPPYEKDCPQDHAPPPYEKDCPQSHTNTVDMSEMSVESTLLRSSQSCGRQL